MPRQNPVRLAPLNPLNHLIEQWTAGAFGCHGLGELADDREPFSISEEMKFSKLGLYREDLSLFAVGGFSRVKEKSRGHDNLLLESNCYRLRAVPASFYVHFLNFRIPHGITRIGSSPFLRGAKVTKGCHISRSDFGNFRLAARSLHFDYGLPWRLLAATAPRDNWGGLSDSNR